MKFLLTLFITCVYLFSNDAFISSSDLGEKLNAKNLIIIDTTNIKNFKKGHIPNAVQVDITAFRKPVGTYVIMRSSEEIQEAARSLGVNSDSEVVLYGHNKGKDLLKCSYIALALITNGFSNVSILDGGFGDWKYEFEDDKSAVSKKIKKIKYGNFVASFNPNIVVNMDYVKSKMGKTPMIEARRKVYYTGEKQSDGVRRLGHITGAMSSYWRDKFNVDDSLKPDKKLNKIFIAEHKLDPEKEVITYCTGGLEASMNWYLLHQYFGYKDVKIYDASMKQWGNVNDTPMEK